MPISKPYNLNFSAIPMLSFISGQFVIGASGAVSSFSGRNIKSVTHLTTGVYRVELAGNVNKVITVDPTFIAGTTGSAVAAASLVANTVYQITVVGTTNWQAIGLPTYLNAAPGQVFVASGAGSGTGTATAISKSGLTNIEVAGDPQQSVACNNSTDGATFVLLSLNATTLTDPASGTVIRLGVHVRMSANNEE